jgi:hypothetical protein
VSPVHAAAILAVGALIRPLTRPTSCSFPWFAVLFLGVPAAYIAFAVARLVGR